MYNAKNQGISMSNQTISERDRAIWRAAITLANNLCVQSSDRINGDDGPPEIIHALSDEAKRIRQYLTPPDELLSEMFNEAGVPENT